MTNVLVIIDSNKISYYNQIKNVLNNTIYLHIIDKTLSMNNIYNNEIHNITPDFLQKNNISSIIILFAKSSVKFKYNLKNITNYLNIFNVDEFVNIYSNISLPVDNLKYIINLYSIEKIVKNINKDIPFQQFCKICENQLHYIKDIKLDIKQNMQYETILFEFNEYPHIEFLIRNTIIRLDEKWSHTVVCGNNNYNYIKNICDKIHPNIRIIRLNMTNISYNDYNNLFLSKTFWELFYGEKLLIYQSDSIIFNSNIDDFLNWDYISAPFLTEKEYVLGDNQIGYGGFSLRSKMSMINVLEKCNVQNTPISEYAKYYMKIMELDNISEDIYFSQNMQQFNIGKVSDINSAKLFSSNNEDCFGIHQIWNSFVNWKNIIIDYNIKLLYNKNKEIYADHKYSYLYENSIINTRPIGSESDTFIKKLSKISIDELDDFVLVLDFYNGGGGTTRFLNTIVSKYKYYNNFVIVRNLNKIFITLNDDYLIENLNDEIELFEYISTKMSKVTLIFVNHFIGFSENFLHKLKNININRTKMVGITHDYSLIYNISQPSYDEINNGFVKKTKFFSLNMFDEIITQHMCTYNTFKSYINDYNKLKIVTLPDYFKTNDIIQYVKTTHTIGIIGNINTLKGEMELINLINIMPNVQFIVFGLFNYEHENLIKLSYNNIIELNELLIKYKPTIMIELSIWPETYSYVLTLYSIIKLPLIILNKNDNNNIVINRSIENNIQHTIANNIYEIKNIINKNPISNVLHTIFPQIKYHRYWDELFVSNYNKILSSNHKHKLNIYPIYFPQFHSFDINDKLFYKGYTDIENLQLLCKSNYLNEIITPSFKWFNIENITEYNIINNTQIIKRQCDLLHNTNLNGIACYYHWFSNNNYNEDNMLMRPAIDELFQEFEKNNKHIFFIWANEDWTSNPAMGNTSGIKLTNTYTIDSLNKNFENIISYFNRKCYLKIENKPVFMIYHSFILNNDEIDLYIKKLNELCINNSFDGVYIYLNIMKGDLLTKKSNANEFYINFNYKLNTGFRYILENQTVIDYEKYIEFLKSHTKDNIVQTLSFDFDNNARLISPNRTNLSTVCIKNYHFLKVKFIKLLLDKYKNTSKNNILLINSLNEWGEKMAIEPSNELGFYYINLINLII